MELLTITQAAEQAGRSIQTVRRMIRQKKVEIKKRKTPQGFNYLITKTSLSHHLKEIEAATSHEKIRLPADYPPTSRTTTRATTQQSESRQHKPLSAPIQDDYRKEVEKFTSTIQKLISQHERDKENFFGLIKAFQDRVVTLEDQIKLLKAPSGKWWQFWK